MDGPDLFCVGWFFMMGSWAHFRNIYRSCILNIFARFISQETDKCAAGIREDSPQEEESIYVTCPNAGYNDILLM